MPLSLTSLSPIKGRTAGKRIVILTGVDFDIVTDSNPAPTMKIKFDGIEAGNVRVYSTTRASCTTPEHDKGKVDVEVENLVVPATDTLVDGYEYERPSLVKESGLVFIVRTLIKKFRRQILDEVVLAAPHTDFDSDTADGLDIAEIAKVPALVLFGPAENENRFYSSNEPRLVDIGGGIIEVRREIRAVDFVFDYQIVDNHPIRKLNLQNAMTRFFLENKFLEVDIDPTDSSKGQVRYELDPVPDGDPDSDPAASNSNILTARGGFLIRGVPIEDDEPLGIEQIKEITTIIQEETEAI